MPARAPLPAGEMNSSASKLSCRHWSLIRYQKGVAGCWRGGRNQSRAKATVIQPVIGRYLTGQIIGQLFGQAAGGVLGDWFGWRNVFFVLAGMFALATAGLIFELIKNPRTRAATRTAGPPRFVADYVAVLSNPWARFVILAVFIESSVAWGAFAYVGADLRLRFGMSFAAIGLIVGAVVLVSAFGPRRLVRWASRSAVFFTAGRRIMRLLR